MKVFSSSQIKCVEDATQIRGITKLRLMENAGSAASHVINKRFSLKGKTVSIVCGNGNNGGDGFVIARKLFEYGANVKVIRLMGLPISQNASVMCKKVMECGISIYDYFDNISIAKQILNESEIIIDAVFGIGLNRNPDKALCEAFSYISSLNSYRISIDVPSGLYSDTGECAPSFINADLTISFIGYKFCHVLPPASSFCGEVVNCAIGVPDDLLEEINAPQIINEPIFSKRDENSHKGTFGTALLICGSYGMAGAAILAGNACLRSGVGIAKLAVPDKIYPVMASALPEAVFIPVDTGENGTFIKNAYYTLKEHIENSNAVLFGCGAGKGIDINYVLRDIVLNEDKTIVIDADGINSLACNIDIIKQYKGNIVLTPHPGEMARLCKTTVSEINNNRLDYASNFAKENGVTVVLKGANTVVAFADGEIYINTTGNAGMATGGSGDMLSGILVSFLAQGMDIKKSVLSAVYIHGKAGDNAALRLGQTSLLPRDMIEELPLLFKNYEG